jgi:hypothetical protein
MELSFHLPTRQLALILLCLARYSAGRDYRDESPRDQVCFDDSDCRSGVCEPLSVKGLKPEQLPCKCEASAGQRNPDGDGVEPLCCRYCQAYAKSEGREQRPLRCNSEEFLHVNIMQVASQRRATPCGGSNIGSRPTSRGNLIHKQILLSAQTQSSQIAMAAIF